MMRPGRLAWAWWLFKRFFSSLEGLTKTLGPIVAAVWIAWQYQQSRIDKRVEATLAYVTRYESADTSVGKAQRALTTSLWDHEDEIGELRSTRAGAQDLATIRSTIVKRVVDAAASTLGRPSVGPLHELDGFYNALGTCVQGRVCDEESAVRFFGCASIDLVDNFGEFMNSRDGLASRFGWGLKWLALRSKASGACNA